MRDEKTKSHRQQQAAELEAKAKSLRRAEAAFWAEVDERADEVMSHLHKEDVLCRTYGVTTQAEKKDLYEHLLSPGQVAYYHRTHPRQTDVSFDAAIAGAQGDARGV